MRLRWVESFVQGWYELMDMKRRYEDRETMEWHDYEMIVHFHEADPAGIAFYGNYVFWQEKAFDSMLSIRGFRHEVGKIGFPVVFIQCRYIKPIRMWSHVKVSMTISPGSDLKKLVTPFRIVLTKTGEICAEGEVHRRFVGIPSLESIECPPEWREAFGFP